VKFIVNRIVLDFDAEPAAFIGKFPAPRRDDDFIDYRERADLFQGVERGGSLRVRHKFFNLTFVCAFDEKKNGD
jgi:hypothetical protein